MIREPSQVAFRAQLVMPEQRQLYDYWLERAAGAAMAARCDIRPADFPRLLPHVSLIDVEPAPRRFRFRLAGTRVREIYDREVTGLYLDEIDWGGQADYWRAAHQRVAERGRPAQGVVRALRVAKDHLVHFWLRLPLRTDGPGVGMILGYDCLMPVAEMHGSVAGSGEVRSAAVG